jgi:DHA1 family inner membrane transport protein
MVRFPFRRTAPLVVSPAIYAGRPLGRGQYLLILSALALGSFAIGTSEFGSMALLTHIAADLHVDVPRAGHLVSAYALGVVVGAPALAILGARLRRRPLLLALMVFYALGNLASAVVPGYWGMMLARFVAGLPHGAYFGVAALVAAAVSRPDQRGSAVGRVMMGLSAAVLVGNPLASWLGEVAGWRWTYALVSAIALLTVAAVAWLLPDDPGQPADDPRAEMRAFNRPQVWLALGIGAVGFAGMFCVFAYLVPTLAEVTRLGPHWVPLALACFGLGSIVATPLGGWLYDRLGFAAVGGILLWVTAVLAFWPFATGSAWTLLPAVALVGSIGALGPALQMRLMDVGTGAQTLTAASHHAAFNVANALGPWLGGLAIGAGYGWSVTGYVGAATTVAGLLVYVLARRYDRQAAGRHAPAA